MNTSPFSLLRVALLAVLLSGEEVWVSGHSVTPPPLPPEAPKAKVGVSAPGPGMPVSFGWNASPDGTNVGGYFLYGSTNQAWLVTTNTQIKVDAGTNTQCSIANTNAGQWYFTVTAYPAGTNYNESGPSNILPVYFTRPPPNFYVLVPQYTATLGSTNWQDLGYFRLKIGPP